jgi:DNA polymerase kappa
MSKDSPYFKNAERRNAQVTMRIARLREQLASVRATRTLEAVMGAGDQYRGVVRLMAEIEAERDLTRTYIVVDMDQFYAAVAERDHAELRGKPVAVGGLSMISTANYEARKFGVRSAMPGYAQNCLGAPRCAPARLS